MRSHSVEGILRLPVARFGLVGRAIDKGRPERGAREGC